MHRQKVGTVLQRARKIGLDPLAQTEHTHGPIEDVSQGKGPHQFIPTSPMLGPADTVHTAHGGEVVPHGEVPPQRRLLAEYDPHPPIEPTPIHTRVLAEYRDRTLARPLQAARQLHDR